ncbi:type III secretion system chaperone [Acanthopleuribacter pedis]|uniref:Type III secretion system chaperone n=1 Tax=Acanthopleuribacter pedis TaxID=442870 RepID=A0A8J7U5F5_9BACT|nr:type III secretion system chaperone [Acanthopleuribacter pedis]MBO1321677.1 type III secretion system chaperone [Acanthopleuribacter pedis]
MESQTNFHRLIAEFGAVIGIPQLAADEEGVCTIALNETYFLHLGYRDSGPAGEVVVTTQLGSVDPEVRAEVFADLLAENLYPETLDLAFAWDKHRQMVVLTAKVSLHDLDAPAFSTFLERFMEINTYWTGRLEGTPAEPVDSPASEDSPVSEPSPPQEAGPDIIPFNPAPSQTHGMFNPKFMA